MFKKSDLKNWTVRRTVSFTKDSSIDVDIRIVSESAVQAVFDKLDNKHTVKELVTSVYGYQNEKGKDLSLATFMKDMADEPAVMHAIAAECSTAQFDAATKN